MRGIYGSKPRDTKCRKIHKNQSEWREKNVLRNLCRMICAGLAICEQIPNVLLAHTLPRSSLNYK